MNLERARKLAVRTQYRGALMVRAGRATSGATHATADVLRAAIRMIGASAGVSVISTFPDAAGRALPCPQGWSDRCRLRPKCGSECAVTRRSRRGECGYAHRPLDEKPHVAMSSLSRPAQRKPPQSDQGRRGYRVGARASPRSADRQRRPARRPVPPRRTVEARAAGEEVQGLRETRRVSAARIAAVQPPRGTASAVCIAATTRCLRVSAGFARREGGRFRRTDHCRSAATGRLRGNGCRLG